MPGKDQKGDPSRSPLLRDKLGRVPTQKELEQVFLLTWGCAAAERSNRGPAGWDLLSIPSDQSTVLVVTPTSPPLTRHSPQQDAPSPRPEVTSNSLHEFT